MERSWEGFADALESSEPDRVNAVIDEVEELDIDERAELFGKWFDDLTALYEESDDGYVRQSIVRVAERLTPGLAAAFKLRDSETQSDVGERLVDQTDSLCGFMLEAMTDEDGRVRQSVKRGLRGVFRTYSALEETGTLEALVVELDEMADEYSGKRREHLLEAKEDAEFSLQYGFAWMLDGLQQELEEENDPDG